MKKICHITINHPRTDVRIFQRECYTLNRNGYNVTLLVNDQNPNEVLEGVNIISINCPLGSKTKRLKAINQLYKKALEIDAEIYHLHEPDLLLFAKKLQNKGKKVIFDSHESYCLQLRVRGIKSELIQSFIRKLYRVFEIYTCKNLDAVIIPGTIRINGDNNWNPFKGINKNICFLANYPKEIDFNLSLLKRDVFKVCYTGILSHERGITHLVKACYKANVPLILAGKFSSKKYEQQLKKDLSFDCVDYRGICTRQEVYDIYKEASLGASILLDFGQYSKLNVLATKVYEYFQCKLPVIVSSYPYANELNEKYHFGITVNTNNISEIVDSILYCKNNWEICRKMGRNGHKLYTEYFNWEKESEKLLSLYKNL